MNSTSRHIKLKLLKHCLKSASPERISRSGSDGERVNCYTTLVRKEGDRLIVKSLSDNAFSCLRFDGSRYSIETLMTFKELLEYEIKVTHYYGLVDITYSGWSDLFCGLTFKIPYAKVWIKSKMELLLQAFFNKTKLVTKDRIEILKVILHANINGQNNVTPLSVMSMLHSDRWYLHPNKEAEYDKVEIYLEALSDTNELKRFDYMQYNITGHGISAIERYEEQERKHSENISNQRRMFWLTIVIALLTCVQAGLIKLPTIIDFTMY